MLADYFDLTQGLTLHGLVTLIALMAYVLLTRVGRQRRHPSAAMAWILFILLLPYLALPLFLVFGPRKLLRPRLQVTGRGHPPREGDWASATLRAVEQPQAAPVEHLVLHADGAQARRALLSLVQEARATIDLSTFILRPDRLGQEVIEALIERARHGVRVRVLIDGLGAWMGGQRPDLDRLRTAGLQVQRFVPPLESPLQGRTNLRNHRKLVVVDAPGPGARLWCGGRNLASEYFEGEPDRQPWTDLSFDLGGPVVAQAAWLFEHDWCFAAGASVPALAAAQRFRLGWQDAPQATAVADRCEDRPATGCARLVASGPDQADDTLYTLLIAACHRADRCIRLAAPYFVPEPELLHALTLAARRGVRVRLLMPSRSNHRLSDLARARSLRILVASGVEVLLTEAMLHAKLWSFDDGLALCGSANLDGRSLFLNYEAMVAFEGHDEVARFQQWFDAQAERARLHRPQAPGLVRDLAEGMVLSIGFQL